MAFKGVQEAIAMYSTSGSLDLIPVFRVLARI